MPLRFSFVKGLLRGRSFLRFGVANVVFAGALSVSSADTQAVSAVVQKVAKTTKQSGLKERREVSEAAAAVLAQLRENEQPSFVLIERELVRKQVVEPVHRQVLGTFSTHDPMSFLQGLEPVLAGAMSDRKWRYFGVALAPLDAERSRVLVVLVESFLDLSPPKPQAQVSDAWVPFSGSVLPPYEKPQVLVTEPSGAIVSLRLTGQGRAFQGVLRCQAAGFYKIEVVAEGKHGPQVLANFQWPCGVALDSLPQVEKPQSQEPKSTQAESEAELHRLLNRDRKQAGLPALIADPVLSQIARAHSEEMARRSSVTHHSPTTGTPEDRVRRAKLRYSIVAENLAQAPTEEEAERSLLESPGHRRNILDRSLTRVGVGVAFATTLQGKRQLYATQLFAGTNTGASASVND
ncbi:MAG TPA: CAP domain-containing protein [Pseudomonadota bacterium]|nr:CAP domain-containing protein [Pseudomonadota bacterium]